MVQTSIDRGDCQTIVYLDDIFIYGTCPERVWQETKLCLEWLCNPGFMMNIVKSAFLVSEMKMLSHMVTKNNICPVHT